VIVFMALSPGFDCETPPMRIPTFPYREREPTFRAAG